MVTQSTRTNIYQRLAAIMADVGRIPKNGYNDFHKYHYALESDVKDGCRAAMVAHGVLLFSSAVSVEAIDKDLLRLTADYTFVNVENPEDRLTIRMFSDGQDKNDKAPYKAMTGGIKYALMNTLLIPTGDDPEKDHAQEKERRPATKAGKGGSDERGYDDGGDHRPVSATASHTPAEQGPPANEKQIKAIYAIGSDKYKLADAQVKKFAGQVLNRTLASMKDITFAEASRIIDIMNEPERADKYIGAATDGIPF